MITTLIAALAGSLVLPLQSDSAQTVCEYRHAFSRGIVPVYRLLRVDATGAVLWLGRLPMPQRGPDSARRAAEAQPVEIHRVGQDRLNQTRKLISRAARGELHSSRARGFGVPYRGIVYRCFGPAAPGKPARVILLEEVTDTLHTENAAPAARALVQWLDSLRALAPRGRP